MKKILTRLFNRKGTDLILTFCVLFLTLFGIIMIGSACMGQTASKGTQFAIKTMGKQGIYAVAGLLSLIYLSKCYKRKWVNTYSCIAVALLGLSSMAICRLFRPSNNSYAWIKLGGFSIQPSEFVKIALIIIFAYVFSDFVKKFKIPRMLNKSEKDKMWQLKFLYTFLIPFCLLVAVVLVGWKVQNDLGSMIVILFVSGIMFLCTNDFFYRDIKKYILIGTGGLLVLGIIFLIIVGNVPVFQSYQIERFASFLDPLSDPYGNGFHLTNSLISLTSGLSGKGFGNSLQKYGFIPESHNDFIFSIIFEELGIFGILCVFVPFCYIIFKLYYYATKIKDEQDRLILIGISTYFFAHFFINIGGVTGFIPMTGIPLLFVSNGGSSLVAAMCAIGIAQSIIARHHRNIMKEHL